MADVPLMNNPMTTSGDVIYGGASGAPTRLAKGSDGQVLTLASGVPSWAAGGGGGSGALVFLEAHTASSSSSLDFTTFISATYDTYKIEVVELVAATSAADLQVQIGTGGTPTYDTGNNYEWAAATLNSGGTTTNDAGSTGVARLFKSMATTAGYGFGTASLTATGLQSTSHRKTIQGTFQFVNSTPFAIYGMWGMQWTTTGTAATALRFIASSGNIASGTIRIYGVAKS